MGAVCTHQAIFIRHSKWVLMNITYLKAHKSSGLKRYQLMGDPRHFGTISKPKSLNWHLSPSKKANRSKSGIILTPQLLSMSVSKKMGDFSQRKIFRSYWLPISSNSTGKVSTNYLALVCSRPSLTKTSQVRHKISIKMQGGLPYSLLSCLHSRPRTVSLK